MGMSGNSLRESVSILAGTAADPSSMTSSTGMTVLSVVSESEAVTSREFPLRTKRKLSSMGVVVLLEITLSPESSPRKSSVLDTIKFIFRFFNFEGTNVQKFWHIF